MIVRIAKADVSPIRQSTQYNCMACSMAMALRANGVNPDECTTDLVNRVMGALPKRGAAWEQALACAQHYGMRATLVVPSTILQLKKWTDRGVPVMIAWNPEDRDWSHASLVFDVDGDLNVYVADPNHPNPNKTVRVVPEDQFYSKWCEKWPDYLVRRPAMAIEREITPEGHQVLASKRSISRRAFSPPKPWRRDRRWVKIIEHGRPSSEDVDLGRIQGWSHPHSGGGTWFLAQIPRKVPGVDLVNMASLAGKWILALDGIGSWDWVADRPGGHIRFVSIRSDTASRIAFRWFNAS